MHILLVEEASHILEYPKKTETFFLLSRKGMVDD